MDLVTIASDSHASMQEHFLLNSAVYEYDIVRGKMDQICPTGEYRDPGWGEMGHAKLQFVIDYLESGLRPDGHWFLFCDADIVFLRPSLAVLEQEIRAVSGQDILLQDDGHEYCAGLFVCKISDKSRELFRTALRIGKEMHEANIRAGRGHSAADQASLNAAIPIVGAKASLLSHRFLNWRHLASGSLWEPGEWFLVPEDTVAFHANWVIGIKKKIQLLQYVVDQVANAQR